MKKLILILLIPLFLNCAEEEIEVGSMYNYHFEHDIQINSEEEAIDWVSTNITYKKDKADYWQLPKQTYKRKKGDCEDFSLLLAYLLEIEFDIKTKLVLIGKGSGRHILVKYNGIYVDAIHGYSRTKLESGWNIIHTIPYPEAIWMAYYYHDNVGRYQ